MSRRGSLVIGAARTSPSTGARRLLTMTGERLSENGREKLLGLLCAGSRRTRSAQHGTAIKRCAKSIPSMMNSLRPSGLMSRFAISTTFPNSSRFVLSEPQTLKCWRDQIIAGHQAHFTKGSTEAANNLVKASEARRLRLLQVPQLPDPGPALRGPVNRDLLSAIRPRQFPMHRIIRLHGQRVQGA